MSEQQKSTRQANPAGGNPGGSAGAAARETNDPNFTAASRPASDRALGDVGTTRMDTGRDADRQVTRTAEEANRRMRGPVSGARVAGDIMTADVSVCSPDSELYYVARMMEERDIGVVPVVESTDTMRLVGIVTDRDIVVRVVAKNQDYKDLRARDVMSTDDLLSVRPDTPLQQCLDRMEMRQVRRVPVVDDTGRLVGIVAQADLARSASQEQVGELVKDVSMPSGESA